MQQRAARVERLVTLERVPERGAFLRRREIVRAHDAVDEPVDAGVLGLHGKRIAMRVRDDRKALAASAHAREKILRAGQKPNVRAVLALQALQVHAEIARPMIEAIPLERADLGLEARRERLLRGRHAHPAQVRVALRHDLAPEQIVEAEIEQRAVHVDEHGVDRRPIDDGCGCSASCPYDTRRPMTDLTRPTPLARRSLRDRARSRARDPRGLRPRRFRRRTQERRLAADGGRPGRAPHHQRARSRRSTRSSRSCRRNRCPDDHATRRKLAALLARRSARRHQGVREAQRRVHGQHRARRRAPRRARRRATRPCSTACIPAPSALGAWRADGGGAAAADRRARRAPRAAARRRQPQPPDARARRLSRGACRRTRSPTWAAR